MLLKEKKQLSRLIRQIVEKEYPEITIPVILLERPRKPEHGDLTTNIAMQLGKFVQSGAMRIANNIVCLINRSLEIKDIIEKVETIKPGFINFWLPLNANFSVINQIEQQGREYGCFPKNGKKILIEFVSANPTGPLHVGHARQAAIGDSICRLYIASGWQVKREFYYNDSGNQVFKLAESVQASAIGKNLDSENYPKDGYRGDYIADIAKDFLLKKSVRMDDGTMIRATGNLNNLENIQNFSVAYLRQNQDLDLKNFGLTFDNYYLESSLYKSGLVEDSVHTIIKNKFTYEMDGALWLKTTELGTGDDKDRVMKKKDGSYTYFVPDIAYHRNKWARGFQNAINIQGSDHHGTIARLRAGLQALQEGIPIDYPKCIFHKMVKIFHQGKEIKASKRSGSYITMRDLINWVGLDAVRYFLVQRKPETEFTFDIDLALSKSCENPVYYIQYAHARIWSMIQKSGVSIDNIIKSDLYLLSHPSEIFLLKRLSEFQEIVLQATVELAPHKIASWLRYCASDFHVWYDSEKILLFDNKSLMLARLRLAHATQQVLLNGLSLIGVSAPRSM